MCVRGGKNGTAFWHYAVEDGTRASLTVCLGGGGGGDYLEGGFVFRYQWRGRHECTNTRFIYRRKSTSKQKGREVDCNNAQLLASLYGWSRGKGGRG